jgi:hypothetical protein
MSVAESYGEEGNLEYDVDNDLLGDVVENLSSGRGWMETHKDRGRSKAHVIGSCTRAKFTYVY